MRINAPDMNTSEGWGCKSRKEAEKSSSQVKRRKARLVKQASGLKFQNVALMYFRHVPELSRGVAERLDVRASAQICSKANHPTPHPPPEMGGRDCILLVFNAPKKKIY